MNRIPRSLEGNPLLATIARQELGHAETAARLRAMEADTRKLHTALSPLARRYGIPLPATLKPVQPVALPQRLINSVKTTAANILRFFKTSMEDDGLDVPVLSKEDIAKMGEVPHRPKSEKPQDILASMMSYCNAVDTQASYYKAVGLNENSQTIITLTQKQLPQILRLAIDQQADKLTPLLKTTKAESLVHNQELIAAMDLFHAIIFAHRFALPGDPQDAGIETDTEYDALTTEFQTYLRDQRSQVLPKNVLTKLEAKDSNQSMNVGFSSMLVYWTFVQLVKESAKLNPAQIKDLLEIKLDSLLQVSQAVGFGSKSTRQNPKLEQEIWNELEAFVEDPKQAKFATKTQLTNEDRAKVLLNRLNAIRNNIHREIDDDFDMLAVAKGLTNEFYHNENFIEGQLPELLSLAYALFAGTKASEAMVKATIEAYFDERPLAVQVRNSADQQLLKDSAELTRDQVLLVLTDLIVDVVRGDGEASAKAEEKLSVLARGLQQE